MEAFITLALVAGLSAAVVWWTVNPPRRWARPRHRQRRRRRNPRPAAASVSPTVPPSAGPTGPEPRAEEFALLPADPAEPPEEPRRALSLVMLALTIAFFAVLAVGVLAALGYLVKTQLDQYFTGP